MMAKAVSAIRFRGDMVALSTVISEANALIGGGLQLDGDLLSAELRNLLVQPVLDASKLFRIDSDLAADGTGDVLVSFHPSDLFLELLAALRAGKCHDV